MSLSANKLQALLEHAPQAIVIVDKEDRILFVNARVKELFGYDQGELLDQSIKTLLPERVWDVHAKHRLDASSVPSMGADLHLVARRKDGIVFPVQVGLTTIEEEGEVFIAAYIMDVTRYQRAENALRQLNTRLEQRNRQLTALHEIGRTLAATLDLQEIYWVMFREIAQGLLGSPHLTVALFDRETETIYCGFAIVDGQEMDASQFPTIPLGEGPVSDTIRTREPRIIDWQETFSRLKESGRAVLTGDERQPKSALYVPMIGGDQVVGVMHVQHYEAGAFREADMPLLSILASQAAVAIANARLYAQEQERADALAQALEQQKELDRLKNEFIQNVSHELRTPLGLAYGHAELLDSGSLGALSSEHKASIGVIARRLRMLRKLVQDLTIILEAETQEQRLEPVHLGELVNTLLEDFRIAAEQAEVSLAAQVPADFSPVSGNALHLYRVLDNLLSNALKFTPAGGCVDVRLWREGKEAVLEVTDTGIGIPPDQLARVFERFYQVDGSMTRRHSGTGLGLALVKEIVEAHDGRVAVRSSVGEGSTFQVRLPLERA